MAIIFNISEAIKDSSFNVLGLQIPMLLENQVEEFQKGSKISDVFVNKTLVKSSRKRKFFVNRSRRLGAKNMTFDWATLDFFD